MVTGISHVGVVVEDLEAAVSSWCDHFGFVVVERQTVEIEGVRNAFLSTGAARGQTMCIELMEPLDKEDMDNAIARRLKQQGEGVYHIAAYVDDPATASRRLAAGGLTVIDRPSAAEGEPVRTIVHPRSANGVLLELT
jgi:methylmalonyl-CoA epimerase